MTQREGQAQFFANRNLPFDILIVGPFRIRELRLHRIINTRRLGPKLPATRYSLSSADGVNMRGIASYISTWTVTKDPPIHCDIQSQTSVKSIPLHSDAFESAKTAPKLVFKGGQEAAQGLDARALERMSDLLTARIDRGEALEHVEIETAASLCLQKPLVKWAENHSAVGVKIQKILEGFYKNPILDVNGKPVVDKLSEITQLLVNRQADYSGAAIEYALALCLRNVVELTWNPGTCVNPLVVVAAKRLFHHGPLHADPVMRRKFRKLVRDLERGKIGHR